MDHNQIPAVASLYDSSLAREMSHCGDMCSEDGVLMAQVTRNARQVCIDEFGHQATILAEQAGVI